MKSNKKMVVILASVIGIMILAIIIIMLLVGSGKKTLSYATVEERIVSAGKRYYSDHEEELPEFGSKTISASTLISEGYLSDYSNKLKEGVSCNGNLFVTKNPTSYAYRASLDCGNAYSTKTLKNIVMKSLVTNGSGLYEEMQVDPNNTSSMQKVYVFKGDNVNNYIKLGDFLWQIVKVYENGEIAVLGDPELLRTKWDNRYNVDTKSYHGINKYDVSRIKDSILSEIVNYNDGYLIIKSLITTHTACIGNRYLDDSSRDGSTECTKTLTDQYFSLLPVYDYMNASLDGNCNKALDNSCYNYNYLASSNDEWWTVTGVADNSEEVYYVDRTLERDYASITNGVRLYAHFASNVSYVSGTGTIDDPYIVK